MPTRRAFLMNSALIASSPLRLASDTPLRLPAGVIEPFQWGDREIPVDAPSSPQTEIITQSVREAMRQHGVVGCGVCVVRGSTVVYAGGFGYAELPDRTFQATTASRCGSLAKSVTALCALILFDQGKLNIDDSMLPLLRKGGIIPAPVGTAQPDERLAQIRVRDLMDHTSGFSGGTTYTAWRADRDVAALHHLNHVASAMDVARDALGSARLDSTPGTTFQYANANFVLLARVVEVVSGMAFKDFLAQVAMPRFGLNAGDIYVSLNQDGPRSKGRGKNEAAYYQTSAERFVSFVPSEQGRGRIYGEAYRGYATESSDGAGGIACSAPGIGKILANLHSDSPALSPQAMAQITTPPAYCTTRPDFDPANQGFYSKGFNVRIIQGRPWFAHGGMTMHCGGIIGHNAGYQFVGVSNWNNSDSPLVDSVLGHALGEATGKIG